MKIPGGKVIGVSHAIGVALVEHILRVPVTGKNIMDFAHGKAVQSCRLHRVQHGLGGRLQRKIVAVGGTAEPFFGISHERTGDHTAHAVPAPQNLPGLAAGIVQLIQRNHVLVGGNLKYGVGGGVDNPLAGFHVLFAVVPDHIRAGIGEVT